MSEIQRNINFLHKLRKNLARKENGQLEILLANFEPSKQKKDIEKRTPVIADFFRTKIDVKPWTDPNFGWTDEKKVMKSIATQFDMPTWAAYHLEGNQQLNEDLKRYTETFISQVKGCNLFCKWCFVDDFNKNGKRGDGSKYFSIPQIVDEFEKEKERRNGNLYRIRSSGGEPTIVTEHWLQLLRELDKRNLTGQIFLQSDTNLTTGHFNDELEEVRIIEKDILRKIAEYPNIALLLSFKGTNTKNFYENTGMNGELLKEQVYSFKKLIEAGLDVYPFFYNPDPDTLERFLDELASEVDSLGNGTGEKVFLKSWVFPLKIIYEPVKERLRKKGINVAEYEKQLQQNFERAEEIMYQILQKRFNIGYKEYPRTGIDLGK